MPTKTKKFCCGSTEAGFSLIELMIVVAIFVLVAAIGIPIFTSTLNRLKLRGAAQQLSELYQEARMRAVQDDTYYEVLLSPDSKQAYVGRAVPSFASRIGMRPFCCAVVPRAISTLPPRRTYWLKRSRNGPGSVATSESTTNA